MASTWGVEFKRGTGQYPWDRGRMACKNLISLDGLSLGRGMVLQSRLKQD